MPTAPPALTLRSFLAGAVAGCAATLPMTVTMEALHRRLPPRERYPLPASELVAEMVELGLLGHKLPRRPHTALTLLAHFGYGTAAGIVAGPLARRLPLPTPAGGPVVGLGVWAFSYLAGLPAAGLLRPATAWPAGRNGLMIAAHLVWGATLGALMGVLEPGANARAAHRNRTGVDQNMCAA